MGSSQDLFPILVLMKGVIDDVMCELRYISHITGMKGVIDDVMQGCRRGKIRISDLHFMRHDP
jgi:hypothetical protein